MKKTDIDTRQAILEMALKAFAEKGYAGASVQEIVDGARVTKPTLYYYFKNKADLYSALVDWAFEERFRLMREAVERGGGLARQLTEICTASFEFTMKNRALMRLAFATAFAAKGEVPAEAQCYKRGLRNFEFIHSLIKKGVAAGEITRQMDTKELAMGFVGIVNFYVMVFLIGARPSISARDARHIVELFLNGAKPS